MDLSFLRFHDIAKTLTAQEGSLTLSQIAFQSLLRLLQVADWIKISKKNKFLTRTLYLEYLLGSGHSQMAEDEFFKLGLSCLYLALEIGGVPEEISAMIQFTLATEYGTYYVSEQHSQNLDNLNSMKAAHTPITSPYDFIEAAKDHILLADFQRLASYVIDLALALPETKNVSAEQVFVASCLFINDRSFNQSIVDAIEGQFYLSIGSGFQMKTVLYQTFLTILDGQQ